MWSDGEIVDLLKEALRYTAPEKSADGLSLASTLAELDVDSVDALEMAGYIEEKVGASFPDDELARINSVADFARVIRQHAPPG